MAMGHEKNHIYEVIKFHDFEQNAYSCWVNHEDSDQMQ